MLFLDIYYEVFKYFKRDELGYYLCVSKGIRLIIIEILKSHFIDYDEELSLYDLQRSLKCYDNQHDIKKANIKYIQHLNNEIFFMTNDKLYYFNDTDRQIKFITDIKTPCNFTPHMYRCGSYSLYLHIDKENDEILSLSKDKKVVMRKVDESIFDDDVNNYIRMCAKSEIKINPLDIKDVKIFNHGYGVRYYLILKNDKSVELFEYSIELKEKDKSLILYNVHRIEKMNYHIGYILFENDELMKIDLIDNTQCIVDENVKDISCSVNTLENKLFVFKIQ
jgi:hypothetical protein